MNNNPILSELYDVCEVGDFAAARTLLLNNPTIYADENYLEFLNECFAYACTDGHLTVAQGLLKLEPNIDMFAYECQCFRMACTNGYLNTALWVLQMKPELTKESFYRDAYHDAKWMNQLHIIQNPTLFPADFAPGPDPYL